MQAQYPPGPGPDHRALVKLHVKQDFFGFLTTMNQKYGDFVRIPLDDHQLYLVSRPDLLKEVFSNDLTDYKKPSFILDFGLRYGDITLSDEIWRRRARVVRPAFLHQRIMQSAQIIIDYTRDMISRWTPGEVINVNEEMRTLRVRIAARTTFDAELEGFGDAVGNAARSGVIPLAEAMGEDFVVSPADAGPPFARMVRRRSVPSSSRMIEIIRACFEARRDRGDVLSFLMQETYDDGTPMSFEEVSEELVLLFFSAHYTLPLVMANAWYQLSQNPDVEQQLHGELDRVLAGRQFGLDDLSELHYGKMLIKETIRMFPPAPILYRELINDTRLDGVTLTVGDYVVVYILLLHYDEQYFQHPHRFWPERFAPEREDKIPSYAYLPFGAGPRSCMGQSLSMLEMRIILATVAEALRLVPVEGVTHAPKAHFVEGKEAPTYMRVEARHKRRS